MADGRALALHPALLNLDPLDSPLVQSPVGHPRLQGIYLFNSEIGIL